MILVLLGTQKHEFKRLVNKVLEINTKEKIIIQLGFTKMNIDSKNIECFDFVEQSVLEKLIKESSFVITHAGSGSITTSLKLNKYVLVMPRLKKYNEHINDHQLEIVEDYINRNLIIKIDEFSDINDIIKSIKSIKLYKFESNNDYFLEQLVKEIDKD